MADARHLPGTAARVRRRLGGLRFAPDAADLARVLDAAGAEDLRARGAAARETYLSTYAPEVTTAQLLGVYSELTEGAA